MENVYIWDFGKAEFMYHQWEAKLNFRDNF